MVAHAVAAHDQGSLRGWVTMYWNLRVAGGSPKTAAGKRQDIKRFLRFFDAEVGGDAVDDWAPAVTKAFVAQLQGTASAKTGPALSPATINRVLATLKHLARFVQAGRPPRRKRLIRRSPGHRGGPASLEGAVAPAAHAPQGGM